MNDHRDALDALAIDDPRCCNLGCQGNWGTGCEHCHTRACGCWPAAYWRHRLKAALHRERDSARQVAARVECTEEKLDLAGRVLLLAVAMPVEMIAESIDKSPDYVRGVVAGYWASMGRLEPVLKKDPEQ